MDDWQELLASGACVAGVDEAGRGPLAGAVFAAAVILDPERPVAGLRDSKKLGAKRRESLAMSVRERALAWSVACASVAEIDELNILHASFLAMHRAVAALALRPQLLLVDGNRFDAHEGIPHRCIIGGDAKYRSIAAASILAKTHRDDLMAALHRDEPRYGWDVNAGYPTAKHRAAIAIHGPSEHHRMSFTLLREA